VVQLQQRVRALEEALRELRGSLPTNTSSTGQSSAAQSPQSPEPSAHSSPQPPGKKDGPHSGPLAADANGTQTSSPHAPSTQGHPTSPSPPGDRGQEDSSPSIPLKDPSALLCEEEHGPREGVAESSEPKQRGFSLLGWLFWGDSNRPRDDRPAGDGGVRAADGQAIDTQSREMGEGPLALGADGGGGSGGSLPATSGVGDHRQGGDVADRTSGVEVGGRQGDVFMRGVERSEGTVVERHGDSGTFLERAVRAWRARANRTRQQEAGHDADP
jgi:hypothetical protein